MSRRIFFALTSTIALVLGLLAASPASATGSRTETADDESYSSYDALPFSSDSRYGNSGAVSATGTRVLTALNPKNVNGCSNGGGPLEVRAGNQVTVEGVARTSWAEPVWAEGEPGFACGIAWTTQVFLSDDGTRGVVVWQGPDLADAQRAFIAYARVSWPASPALGLPTIDAPVLLSAERGQAMFSATVSRDGSRLALAWPVSFGSEPPVFRYSVVDLESPSFARVDTLPLETSTVFNQVYPSVKISTDGEVVAIGVATGLDDAVDYTFNKVQVYTCTVFCNPSRLKTFYAALPSGKGGRNNFQLAMNAAGTRVFSAWGRNSDSTLSTLVLSPQAAGGNVLTSIKNVATWVGSEVSLAMNEAGTQVAVAGQGFDEGPGTPVVTASVDAKLALKSVKTNFAALPVSQNVVMSLSVLNASAGNLERLLITTRSSNSSTVSVLISDSVASPTNWGTAYSRTPSLNFDFFGVSVSRNSSRYIVFGDLIDGEPWTEKPVAVVGSLKKTITMTTAPKITGSAAWGKKQTLSLGKWAGAGNSVTYLWKRNDVALNPQPNSLNYQATSNDDMGGFMSAVVSVSKDGFYPVSRTVYGVGQMTGKPIELDSATLLNATGAGGAPRVGDTLGVGISTPRPDGTSSALVWKRGSVVVGSGQTYTVQAGDVGKTITVTLTLTKDNFKTLTRVITTKKVVS